MKKTYPSLRAALAPSTGAHPLPRYASLTKRILASSILSLFFFGMVAAGFSQQSAGFNSSYAVFDRNGSSTYFCMFSNTSCGSNPNLDGASLGTFIKGLNTLVLRGAEHNVFKCGGADITNTFLSYRVYPQGSPSGSFTQLTIGFGEGSFSNNNGCGGQDQRWNDLTENVNLLASMGAGNYTIEIFSKASTTLGDRFLSNNGNNYRANFTVADAGFNSSYAVFNVNGSNASYCMPQNTSCGSNPLLQGANLGSHCENAGTLSLRGGENNVFKCFTADITATALNYRIYPMGSPSGSFASLDINFVPGDGSVSNANGCGGQDQRWRDLGENVDLTTLSPGNYTIEIFASASTNGGARFLNNGAANYTANFTIVAPTSNTTTISACDSYTWSVNGVTYTSSGTYTVVNGCATEILDLTITPSTSNTTTLSACDSYTWSVNGVTYTSSGTYTVVNGCATEILDLTITPSTSNTTTISACDSYTWSVNGVTYTSGGTYTVVNGCATEILDLTITPSTSNTTTISACDNYTWSVNGVTYASSGTYTVVNGCATEILDLTINPGSTITENITACGSAYTWSVNGETYTSAGQYISVDGCVTYVLNLSFASFAPVVTAGVPTGVLYNAFEARWKGLNNTSGVNTALYLGNANMGAGGTNRVQVGRNGLYTRPGETPVTFHYDKANDQLTATVGSRSLVYTSISTRATGDVNVLNFMHIFLRTGSGSNTGTAEFKNVLLNGNAIGPFFTPAASTLSWTVTNVDFNQGFTLSGTLVLTSGSYGSNEGCKLDIWVGNNNSPLPCSAPPIASASPSGNHSEQLKATAIGALDNADEMEVTLQNNPALGGTPFGVRIKAAGSTKPVQMRVVDAAGRSIENRQQVPVGALVEFGQQYRPGLYFVEFRHGSQRKVLKAMKQ
jgi:hypothetical protein